MMPPSTPCARTRFARACCLRAPKPASGFRLTTAITGSRLQLNLPHTSMRDLGIHENDLIVATHGRSFWILDDITPVAATRRIHGEFGRLSFQARSRLTASGAAPILTLRSRRTNRLARILPTARFSITSSRSLLPAR